jgi:protein involved in polysaccharide export with SLBB domain
MAVRRLAVRRSARVSLVALSLALLAAACTTGQSVRPDSIETLMASGRFEPWSDTIPGYRISEGDKLHVSFPLTPEMSEDVLVRSDGVVTLRAAGEVQLAALSTGDASTAIAEASARRLKNPRVQIAVTDNISERVFVGGEVTLPGAYLIHGRMTVTGALASASGSKDTARLDEVILLRRAPDDKPMIRLINVRDILEGEATDLRVYQGDILFVPKTRIAEFDLWVNQFLNLSIPFAKSFSYATGDTTTTNIAR